MLTAPNSLNPNSESASGLTDGARVSQQLLKGAPGPEAAQASTQVLPARCPEVAVGKDSWAERPLRTEHLGKG